MRNRFIVEVVEEKKKAVLVYRKKTRAVDFIHRQLKKNYSVYETTDTGQELSGYDLAFFIDAFPNNPRELHRNKLNILVTFFDKEEYGLNKKWCEKHLKGNYKIVNIGLTDRKIGELLDFILYKTPTPYAFDFSKNLPRKLLREEAVDPLKVALKFLKYLGISIVLANFLFIIFFCYQWFLLWGLWRNPNQEMPVMKKRLQEVGQVQAINDTLVLVPKNTLFWLPGVDKVLEIERATKKTTQFLDEGSRLFENYSLLMQLILRKSKSESEIREVKLRIKTLNEGLDRFDNLYYGLMSEWKVTNIPFLNARKEEVLGKLIELEDYIKLAERLGRQLPYLLGSDSPRKYLVLFMNNMELRPGGGFIGSLGVIEFANFGMNDLKVYDVYTLDGQLKVHIDPPLAIREHMGQPHWFLRDSNFSADFPTNAVRALDFIEREVGWQDFDGVVGVTLSAVQKFIALFPDLTVSDYNETITPDNFFLKAQTYAEKDFFPGSHSKRNFLESVVRSLIIRMEEGWVDQLALARVVRDVFEEKFMVVYFPKDDIESVFDELFWTGRVVKPGCSLSKKCFFDYLSLVDANLGVNKTNFFVQRTIRMVTRISEDGSVRNRLIAEYVNESVNGVFPGGNYKNYLQVMLPKNAKITSVAVDNEKLGKYEETVEMDLRKIGLLVQVPPESQRSVTVEYGFIDKLAEGADYQLIVQKQTGSINNDFIYEMRLPPNTILGYTNFAPIVSQEGLVYNTYLHKDRILLVTFK